MQPGLPESRGVKFLMGKQGRAAGCPEKGDRKDEGEGRGGDEEEQRESSSQGGTKIPKAPTWIEEWGVFYGGIVKCALSFPLAGGKRAPPLSDSH